MYGDFYTKDYETIFLAQLHVSALVRADLYQYCIPVYFSVRSKLLMFSKSADSKKQNRPYLQFFWAMCVF